MRIVTFAKIRDFIRRHSTSEVALSHWYLKAKESQWNTLHDIKKTFNSVDYVGNNRYVFNVKGNDYRLIAIVIFASKKCISVSLEPTLNTTK